MQRDQFSNYKADSKLCLLAATAEKMPPSKPALAPAFPELFLLFLSLNEPQSSGSADQAAQTGGCPQRRPCPHTEENDSHLSNGPAPLTSAAAPSSHTQRLLPLQGTRMRIRPLHRLDSHRSVCSARSKERVQVRRQRLMFPWGPQTCGAGDTEGVQE